ncbi:MAG: amidohydrolase family protein [Opitutaceae bacterium]
MDTPLDLHHGIPYSLTSWDAAMPESVTIDAHHHFWRYDPEEYGWIGDSLKKIRRDFLPEDLEREMASAGVDGVVSVQARQSLVETRWLMDLAARNDFIRGVVGWVDLRSPRLESDLESLATMRKLKGIRHGLQSEPDDALVECDDFNRGIRALKRISLAYDLLVVEHQLPAAIRLVDRHPEQVFILDHIAKPRIRDGLMEPWQTHVRDLARRPNVFCKLSGMVTEADFLSWTGEQLRPYFEIVLDAFGPQRLMFGSDWPVCLVACGYQRWRDLVFGWLTNLSTDEQARVLGGTAIEAYRL